MDLLPQPGPLVTAEAPRPGVSAEDVSRPYSLLAENLKKAGEGAESFAEQAATQEGYKAVTRDADGKLQVQKSPIIGPASQNYEHAMKIAALAEGEGAAKEAEISLRRKYPTDPEGYLQAANEFKNGVVSDWTEKGAPEVGLALGRVIDTTTAQSYRGLWAEKQRTDTASASKSIDSGIASARGDLMTMARGGDTSSPDFQRALDKANTLIDTKTQNPLFAYPKEQADYDKKELAGEVAASGFLYRVDQTYQNAPTKADGAKAALDSAKSILTDPNYKLSPEERQKFYSKAVGEIHANEAIRRQDISEARAAEQSLKMMAAYGGRIAPEDVESVANAYTAAGAPGERSRLYAWAARAPLNDDFGRQPLPAQTQQLGALQGGAAPSSAGEARLIENESRGNPTLVNKLGFAGTYQFGAPLLKDLGVYTPGAGENVADRSAPGQWSGQKWSGSFAIPGFPEVKSLRDFLANPQAQKAAYDLHVAKMDSDIASNGLDKYIGQTVGGVPITREGLHMMIHLGGVQGAQQTLSSGGAINPADANGTTLLHYASLGASAAAGDTPSSALWQQANRSHVLDKTAQTAWSTIQKDFNDKGIRPHDDIVVQVTNAARAARDWPLLDQIGTDVQRWNTAQQQVQEPLPAQQQAITALQAAGNSGQLSPGQANVLGDLQKRYQAVRTGLENNPIGTTVANFPDKFRALPPLDYSDPATLAAGLKMRGQIAQFAADNWQSGPVAALDQADMAQMRSVLTGPDVGAKAQVFGALNMLPEDVRNATLRKLSDGGPEMAVGAAAGSMLQSAPEVAQSILRGQMALKTDKAYWPEGDSQKQATQEGLNKALPPNVFGLAARTDPQGPYAIAQGMVKARYADLSAQASDVSGKFNGDRLTQSVNDVTGGILSHNGAPLIAPQHGMSQPAFDVTMAGVSDADLPNVTTLNGAPVDANYLRSSAQLESVGQGRYLVRLGADAARPIYAYQGANTEQPQKFVLDLRGRGVTPAAAQAYRANQIQAGQVNP